MSPPHRPPYSFGYSTFPTSLDGLARVETGGETPARGGHDWIDPDLVPSWLTPFTLDARTRFTRTPEALLRRRDSKATPDEPAPPEPEADAPSWYFVMDPADMAGDRLDGDAVMLDADGVEILPQPPLHRPLEPWGQSWGQAAEFPGASFDAAAEASAGRAFFDDAERWIASLSDPAPVPRDEFGGADAATTGAMPHPADADATFGGPLPDAALGFGDDAAGFTPPAPLLQDPAGLAVAEMPAAPETTFCDSMAADVMMTTDHDALEAGVHDGSVPETAFDDPSVAPAGLLDAAPAHVETWDHPSAGIPFCEVAPATWDAAGDAAIVFANDQTAAGTDAWTVEPAGIPAQIALDPVAAVEPQGADEPVAPEPAADAPIADAPDAVAAVPAYIRRMTRLIVAGTVHGMPAPAGDQDRAAGVARPVDAGRLTARFIANVWSGYPQVFGGAPLPIAAALAAGLVPAAASEPVAVAPATISVAPAEALLESTAEVEAQAHAQVDLQVEAQADAQVEAQVQPEVELAAPVVVLPPVAQEVEPEVAEEILPPLLLDLPAPVAMAVPAAEEDDGAYHLPPLDLLREPPHVEPDFELSEEFLDRNSSMLGQILRDFGIRGEVIDANPGPVVTLYEFEPAPGIKSSRVIGLAADIARSMSAISARVAVVEGRNVIGIELPNRRRETVWLRELLTQYAGSEIKGKLGLCLGKTIGGAAVNVDLARMPHLLVAGTTGSGKSVAINTMILSLLYHHTPQTCRLIMIDPKMLELSVYEGIPHLLTPVVTDPKKAIIALKWAVKEMEDRYRKMSRLAVRNIDGFNARVREAAAKGEVIRHMVQAGFDKENGEALFEERDMDLTPLPFIVVIVDEMADLMMVAGKEIEGAIQRLAQMARAAGIHLVMATQRPSVDVITGTIKANFPTRISFQVTSKIDSRTILGEMGAETLLGQGDMLYMAGGGRISRVHGPFVSDAEVEHVVAFLKAQGGPDYLDAVILDEADGFVDEDDAVFDKSDLGEVSGDLYEQAVAVVMRDRKASTSYIQRRLQVGYNKAASLMERMENEGIVGPANHAGKREILSFSRPG